MALFISGPNIRSAGSWHRIAWRFRWSRIDLSGRDGLAVRIGQALAEAVGRRVLVVLLVVPVVLLGAGRVVQGAVPGVAGQVDRDATTAMMPSAPRGPGRVVQGAVQVVLRAGQGDLRSGVRIAARPGSAAGVRDATLGTAGIAPVVPRGRSGLTDQGAGIDLR